LEIVFFRLSVTRELSNRSIGWYTPLQYWDTPIAVVCTPPLEGCTVILPMEFEANEPIPSHPMKMKLTPAFENTCFTFFFKIQQKLSYRQQIARQLRTRYAEGINRLKYYTVTLKSR